MITLKFIRDFDYKIAMEFDDRIQVTESSIPKSISANIPAELPDSLKYFYQVVTRFYYKWETINLLDSDGLKLKGRVNILPAETVVRDWEGTTYFNDADGKTPLQIDFKPLPIDIEESLQYQIKEPASRETIDLKEIAVIELKAMKMTAKKILGQENAQRIVNIMRTRQPQSVTDLIKELNIGDAKDAVNFLNSGRYLFVI